MLASTVRLNITLPADLANSLKHFTAPRQQSRFIAEAVAQKIKHLKKKQMEKLLVEGYQVTKNEGLRITEEFGACDLEGWHDY